MLLDDGHADAEAETRSPSWALGRIERVKEPWKRFGKNAHAVVLNGNGNVTADATHADLNAPGIADFPDSMFRVADQIEQDLDELIGIADDRLQTRLRLELHLDAVAAERVFV